MSVPKKELIGNRRAKKAESGKGPQAGSLRAGALSAHSMKKQKRSFHVQTLITSNATGGGS